jgi:hypothetical protein
VLPQTLASCAPYSSALKLLPALSTAPAAQSDGAVWPDTGAGAGKAATPVLLLLSSSTLCIEGAAPADAGAH